MNPLNRMLAALLASVLLVAYPTAQAEPSAKTLPDYTVFVDPPTGFVFVKLPAGWKFVATVQARDLARLPASVVTALLAGDDDAAATDRLASSPGM